MLRKKWLWAIVLIIIIIFSVNGYYFRQLKQHRQELELLKDQAWGTTREAINYFNDGQYQLGAVVSRPFIEAVLEHLGGYEQLTRKGNRFTIHRLETEFDEGFIRIKSDAHFKWRWGFYDGPIEVDYLAFARLNEDGSASLHVRVENVTPVQPGFLLRSSIRHILIVNMQKHMRITDIPLPIGGIQTLTLPEVSKTTTKGVAYTIPERKVAIPDAKSLVFCTPQMLGIISVHPSDKKGDSPNTLPDSKHDLLLYAKTKYINDLLTAVFSSNPDAEFLIPLLENVWQKKHRLFKREVTSSANLVNLKGQVDLINPNLEVGGENIMFSLNLEGQFDAVVEANVAGVTVNLPVTIYPKTEERIPVIFDAEKLVLKLPNATVPLDLQIETQINSFSVAFNHVIELNTQEFLSQLYLPGVFEPKVYMPTLVEKAAIVEKKPIDLEVTWSVDFPDQTYQGFSVLGNVEVQHRQSLQAAPPRSDSRR